MNLRPRSTALLAGGLLLLSFCLDESVRNLFTARYGSWLDYLMEAASVYGRGGFLTLLVTLLFVLGFLLKKPAWSNTAVVCLGALLGSALVVQLAKHLLGRARPRLLEPAWSFVGPSLTAGVAGLDSFPSGHAITTFALAALLERTFPRGRIFFYSVALVISFSRIYLGAHFVSDVVAGAILGALLGYLLDRYSRPILRAAARLDEERGLLSAALVTAFAAFLFFHQLKAVALFDVDEAVFAEATREMMETGDLLTPIYNYAPRYDKPIFFYWLMASAFAVFGSNEFAARFWSAVAGCALVAMTFLFARAAVGLRCALLSALILVTSVEMVALSRLAITDMVLTFFIAASLYSFYLAVTKPARADSGRWALTGWVMAGLAVLTKGPIGIVFPVTIVPLLIWLSGNRRVWRALRPAAGLALFCLVALPWYAVESWITKNEFLEVFFLKHNVQRYLSVNSGHSGPWYYYLVVILIGFFPWSVLLPASIKSASKQRGIEAGESLDSVPLFLLLWITVVLVVFSLARTKLPNYIAPLFPAMSILVGWWCDRFLFRENTGGARATAFLGSAASLVVAAVVCLSHLFMDSLQARLLPPGQTIWNPGLFPIFVAAIFALYAGGFFLLSKPDTAALGLTTLAVCMTIFSFGLIESLLPRVSVRLQEPLRILSNSAADRLEDDTRLIVFGLNNPSILFYAKRAAIVLGRDDSAGLKETLKQPRRFLVITEASLLEKLSGEILLHPVERQGAYVLVSNRPG
jgi:4-amino-4-deoxy-L-arabinose transferase-like glycosyltransferase/membrane-associated phospholipid phosphatase